MTASAGQRCKPGFTLVEMLVVLAIIALLMAILFPSVRSVKRQADALVCMSNLRQIAFEFQVVTDNPADLRRWDSFGIKDESHTSFGLTSFIDKLYAAGAYHEGQDPATAVDRGQGKLFFCPSADPVLEVKQGRALTGAVREKKHISYAFNSRLHHVYRPHANGMMFTKLYVSLGANILNWPRANKTPLLLDVDGRLAAKSLPSYEPHLIAPAIEPPGPGSGYMPIPGFGSEEGLVWFPSSRHSERTNIALLDGSVHALKDPLGDPNRINWADAVYQGRWQDGQYVGATGMLRSLWSIDSLNSMSEVH